MFNTCQRYRRYRLLCEDGTATPRQEAFVRRHESVCGSCALEHEKTMSALAFLRDSVIEPEPDPGFESRFLRVWRIEKRARAVSYWMPAVAGAVVASVALMAVLQILFSAPARDDADLTNREALRETGPSIPSHSEGIYTSAPR